MKLMYSCRGLGGGGCTPLYKLYAAPKGMVFEPFSYATHGHSNPSSTQDVFPMNLWFNGLSSNESPLAEW